MASNFLAGNSGELTGSVGAVSQNLGQSVGGRLGGSHEHELIVDLRVVATALIWLLAAAGFVRRLRARRADVGMAVIAVAPSFCRFSSPTGARSFFACFSSRCPRSRFSWPAPRSRRKSLDAGGSPSPGSSSLAACSLGSSSTPVMATNASTISPLPMPPLFMSSIDRSARCQGLCPERQSPLAVRRRTRLITTVSHGPRRLDAGRAQRPAFAAELLGQIASKGGGYVIVTRSTEIAADLLDGKPGVIEGVVNVLRTKPTVRELYGNADGELFDVTATPARKP